jgi:hypothetical protein
MQTFLMLRVDRKLCAVFVTLNIGRRAPGHATLSQEVLSHLRRLRAIVSGCVCSCQPSAWSHTKSMWTHFGRSSRVSLRIVSYPAVLWCTIDSPYL